MRRTVHYLGEIPRNWTEITNQLHTHAQNAATSRTCLDSTLYLSWQNSAAAESVTLQHAEEARQDEGYLPALLSLDGLTRRFHQAFMQYGPNGNEQTPSLSNTLVFSLNNAGVSVGEHSLHRFNFWILLKAGGIFEPMTHWQRMGRRVGKSALGVLRTFANQVPDGTPPSLRS